MCPPAYRSHPLRKSFKQHMKNTSQTKKTCKHKKQINKNDNIFNDHSYNENKQYLGTKYYSINNKSNK